MDFNEEDFRKQRAKEALDDFCYVFPTNNDALARRFVEKYHTTIELALQNLAHNND